MDAAGTSKLTSPRTVAAFTAAVACAVFAGTLGYDFVYDDLSQILNNPWIWHPRFLPDIVTRGVWSFRDSGPANYYRPVQILLYFLDAQIFGRHPFGFHLTNVLAHALASATAFLLLRRVTGETRAAFAAGLFALHPAHVESVAWISGSTDVDCALLAFLCLLTWSHARETSGRHRTSLAACSSLLYLLALLAKETAAVTPILALAMPARAGLSEGRPRRSGRGWREAAWLMTAFGAALVLYVPVRLHAMGGVPPLIRHAEFTTARILANGCALVPRFLLVVFFPWRLVPDRVFDPVAGFSDPLAVTGALILAGALVAAIAFRRNAPPATFGIALLVLPLLPVLQVQYVGPNPQSDRYLYIPALGACLLVAEAAAWLWKRLEAPVAHGVLLAICLLLGALAAARTVTAARMWRSGETLARAGIALEPRSVIMRLNLAHALDQAGRVDAAYDVLKQATEVDPTDPAAAADLESLRIRREARTPEDALAGYRGALAVHPGEPVLLTNLAVACVRAGRYEEAIQAAQDALASDRIDLEALLALGTARGRLGDYAGQERDALRLLEIDPEFSNGWLNLGAARLALGDLDRSEEDLRHAVTLDRRLARAHLYLSVIASRRKDTQEAVREARLASDLDTGDAEIWNHLGVMLVRSGDRDAARRAWERALAIAPGDASVRKNLERLKGGVEPEESPSAPRGPSGRG